MAPIKSNNPVASYFNFFSRSGIDAVTPEPPPPPPPAGLTATGGIISDYEVSGTYYRAHVFTSLGAFNVTELSTDFPNNVEYLVMAGGGGAGTDAYPGSPRGSGGGGAGGIHSNHPDMPLPRRGAAFPVSVQSYPIVVGGGGIGSPYDGGKGTNGVNSNFSTITSTGGGAGGGHTSSMVNGNTGGSGGGATNDQSGLGVVSPSNQGFPGGNGATGGPYAGGGGGGAGGAGTNAPNSAGGNGGPGIQIKIAGPPTHTGTGALNPGPGEYQWFGGGGAGYYPAGTAGVGGGGISGPSPPNTAVTLSGQSGTGGGGGGTRLSVAGGGGSGIVVVRYQIGSSELGSAKATGGAISYYGDRTIHTFIGSGTFATTASWSATDVEYVAIAGGGGSNNKDLGGAGGAGGFITGTTPIGAHPVSTTIQVGAGGNLSVTDGYRGSNGTPSFVGAPLTAYGGGGGASKQAPAASDASPGGSGGGGDWGPHPGAAGDKQTGTSSAAPITPQGFPGGNGGGGSPATYYSTGGGGGAGGAGGNGGGPYVGGQGGIGRQISATFRNPKSATSLGGIGPTGSVPGTNPGGDTSGKFWFAGGGGGGSDGPGGAPGGGGGAPSGGGISWAGGGIGGDPDSMGTDGLANTGGGGGATDNGHLRIPSLRGNGGSGLVLIAYPT